VPALPPGARCPPSAMATVPAMLPTPPVARRTTPSQVRRGLLRPAGPRSRRMCRRYRYGNRRGERPVPAWTTAPAPLMTRPTVLALPGPPVRRRPPGGKGEDQAGVAGNRDVAVERTRAGLAADLQRAGVDRDIPVWLLMLVMTRRPRPSLMSGAGPRGRRKR
jgi:hypothetical protein